MDAIVDPMDVVARRVNTSVDLYITDLKGNLVRKVTGSSGVISTVAGTGTPGFSGDGGAALNATLQALQAIAVAGDGTLYICANNRVRKISTAGVITTVAGNGNYGYTGDNGAALQASLGYCRGLIVDAQGALYLADSDFHVVRKISASGIITTVAGTGVRGDSGDGGPATAARFLTPFDVELDGSGNLYILDHDAAAVRRVDAQGTITTYAGAHLQGYGGDGGPAGQALLLYPNRVALDAHGNVLILDGGNNRLRRVDAASGLITTIAGNGTLGSSGDGGPGTQAQLLWPNALATDTLGNVYIGNRATTPVPFSYDNRVRRLDPNGLITTIVALSSNGDGEVALQAIFNPYGLATGPGTAPDLYIVDRWNQQVRKVDGATRVVSTVAGTTNVAGFAGDGGSATYALLNYPTNVTTDGVGRLWIADTANHRIRYVDSAGTITTVAGTGVAGYSGDGGDARNAKLFYPQGMALDSAGSLYIADMNNNRIRKLSGGIITTIAGTGTSGSTGDGGPATAAQLQYPNAVAVAPNGSVYIADAYRLRKIGSDGTISAVAGNGFSGYSGDGGLASNALINGPRGLSLDVGGALFFFDAGNNRARRIDAAGIITTVAGSGTAGDAGDGGIATSASLYPAAGIALDPAGHLYLSQSDTLRVRVVTLQQPQSSNGISGELRYYSNGMPVDRVSTLLQGPTSTAVTTGTSGQFAFNNLTSANWNITPQKIGNVGNSISALDAAYIMEASVGKRTLSGNQQLACDVSGNGAISTLDAALVLQYKVGLISRFPVANACGSDWAFVPVPNPTANEQAIQPQIGSNSCRPGTIAFRPLSGQVTNQSFSAITFGDCTGSWQPSGSGGTASLRASTVSPRTIQLGRARRHGSHLEVPFNVVGQAGFRGLDIQIDYDASRLTSPRVRRVGSTAGALLAVNARIPGVLLIALARGEAIDASTPLVLDLEIADRQREIPMVRITHGNVGE